LGSILEGSKGTANSERVEHPGSKQGENDEEHDHDDRKPRSPAALEQRPPYRRSDSRLDGRVPTSIADQRFVRDLGTAVLASHELVRTPPSRASGLDRSPELGMDRATVLRVDRSDTVRQPSTCENLHGADETHEGVAAVRLTTGTARRSVREA